MEENIEQFLKEFKLKMDIWDIVFIDNRPKNTQTLADLEITSVKRKTIIKELVVADYSEGPMDDVVFMGSPLWVFGKEVKAKEIYIKLSMGFAGRQVLCISFHVAEYPMNYPYNQRR